MIMDFARKFSCSKKQPAKKDNLMEIDKLYIEDSSLKGSLNFFYEDAKYAGRQIQYYRESEGRWRVVGNIGSTGGLNVNLAIDNQKTIRFQTVDGKKKFRTINRDEIPQRSSSPSSSNYDTKTEDIGLIKKIALYPFDLVRDIFIIPIFLIKIILIAAIGFPLLLILWLFSILIMLPISLIVTIVTFGKVRLWKDRLFDKVVTVKEWIEDSWELPELKVLPGFLLFAFVLFLAAFILFVWIPIFQIILNP